MYSKTFRAPQLVQWNARQSKSNPNPLVDKVVEAVLHQQGIPFEHTSEYRSIYSYDKLMEQLEHYDRNYKVQSGHPDLIYGLKQAHRLFSSVDGKKLSAIILVQTAQKLFSELGLKGDRSAGLTCYGATKIEAFGVGLDKAYSILREGKSPAPCLAGFRTQRKEKTRLVWMYPLEMTIIEAVVARPLIDYFTGIEHVMSLGDTSHETGLRLRRSAANNRYTYGIDYSQFDSTVGPLFITNAFRAFRTWFNLEDKIIDDVTVGDVFTVIERYFATAPIVMPNDQSKYPRLYTGKKGGVPSGSYFTQLVDSFTNVALTFAISSKFGLKLRDQDVNVLGDDSRFFCNCSDGDILLQKISSFVSRFGFKVNTDKSDFGLSVDKAEYLGRDWKNGFPLRDMHHIIRGALYPERRREYSEDPANRRVQAMNVIASYLLTSYVEDPQMDVDQFNQVYFLTKYMTSGYADFLLREGLLPGKVLKRAIY